MLEYFEFLIEDNHIDDHIVVFETNERMYILSREWDQIAASFGEAMDCIDYLIELAKNYKITLLDCEAKYEWFEDYLEGYNEEDIKCFKAFFKGE